MTALPRAARLYVCVVVAVGVSVGGLAVTHVRSGWAVLGLAALTVVCTSLSDVPDGALALSLGFVVGIAAIFIDGLAGGVLVGASGALMYAPGGQPFVKRAFNA